MNKYEYKLEFESDFKDILIIINEVNDILINSSLSKNITNIKPTFTIVRKEDNNAVQD